MNGHLSRDLNELQPTVSNEVCQYEKPTFYRLLLGQIWKEQTADAIPFPTLD